MNIIKFIFLVGIFGSSTFIGLVIAKKYSIRVKELMEFKNALSMFVEKIKFTYEPVPDVFMEISKVSIPTVSAIFENAAKYMKVYSAGEAWEKALKENNETKLIKEDIDTLRGLAKMLGRTDLDGQVNEIELVNRFLDTKIQDAELEKRKNEKLFKSLGATIGLAIVVILA